MNSDASASIHSITYNSYLGCSGSKVYDSLYLLEPHFLDTGAKYNYRFYESTRRHFACIDFFAIIKWCVLMFAACPNNLYKYHDDLAEHYDSVNNKIK